MLISKFWPRIGSWLRKAWSDYQLEKGITIVHLSKTLVIFRIGKYNRKL